MFAGVLIIVNVRRICVSKAGVVDSISTGGSKSKQKEQNMKMTIRILCIFAALYAYAQAQTVELLSTGTEEAIGNNGRLSDVAVDQFDQPHIACDGGTFLYFYDKNNGAWKYSELNVSPLGYRQFYNPHIEIDSGDRSWISGILVAGLGLVVRESMSVNPSVPCFSDQKIQGGSTWDSGNLSIDPAYPLDCVLMSARGKWKKVQYSASSPTKVVDAGNGTLYAGADGEKKGFWISKTGSIWHNATGGYDEGNPSQYQNSTRNAQGLPRVTWASFAQYSTMGDDGAYVDCVSDILNPQIAYISCDFSVGGRIGGTAGVAMNIWNGSVMVFPSTAILSVDKNGNSGLRRFAPQIAPAKNGGVFITWTRANRIKLRYITQLGVMNPEWDIADGTMSSLCTDSQGNIHLVYKNGGMKYRKVLVSSSIQWNVPPVDFNGDKTNEVAFYDPLNGRWSARAIGASNGFEAIFGESNCVPIPGNYDTDQNTDLGIYDIRNSIWTFKLTGQMNTFTMQWGYAGCQPVPGDYDGDKVDDLCVYNSGDGNWYVWSLSKGWMGNTPSFGSTTRKAVSGDYNGDGKFDLATFDMVNGNWSIRELDVLLVGSYPLGVPNSIPFVGKYSTGLNFVSYLNGMWTIGGVVTNLNWGYKGAVPVVGDYDGDGTNDPTVYDAGTWYSRTVGGNVIYWGTKLGYKGAIAVNGDYDGDKKTDLTVFDAGKWIIKFSKTGIVTTNNWGFKGGLAMSGDVDGDGMSDLCVVDTNQYYWYVYSVAKTNVIAWSVAWGYKGTSAFLGDYDGDKKDDFAIFDKTGKWYVYSLAKNAIIYYGYPFGSYMAFAGDYTGDGVSDLISYSTASYSWTVKKVGNQIATVAWGYQGCQPLSGDFDGDGKYDLNCVDSKTFKWYSLSLTKGVVVNGKQWGSAGMLPAFGDYDGDGVTDMATLDKSTGRWYIYSPKKNIVLLWDSQFGYGGVIPFGSISK